MNNNETNNIIQLNKNEFYMCSKEEMIDRETNHQLSIFEINTNINYHNNNCKLWKADPTKIIKAYYRINSSSNNNYPIRSVNTLIQTLNYILNNIIDSKNKFISGNKVTYADIFLFVNDRFKSIRQDFTLLNNIQNYSPNELELYEKSLKIMIRYYIISLNQSLSSPLINGPQGLYQLILPQINSMLINLKECFMISQQTIQINNDDYDEFYSYFLLVSLYLNSLDFYTTLSHISQFNLHEHPKLHFTLKVCQCILSKNWKIFFNLIKTSPEVDYITSCLLVIYFPIIRIEALRYICYGFSNEITHYKISLDNLANMLLFNSIESLYDFLIWFGLDKNIKNENTTHNISLCKYYIHNVQHNLLTVPKETCVFIENKRTLKTVKEEIIKNININDIK